ncbi:MAG: DinB family protein [Bacteroidota bacterium]
MPKIKQLSDYRDRGAIGALLDEYERALEDLLAVMEEVQPEELVAIVDPDTKDPDCRSIQSILTHVVRSGYYYAEAIRVHQGESLRHRRKQRLQSIADYRRALLEMFAYNERVFEDYPRIKLIEKNPAKKIRVRWKQRYDVDQLLEHAICHLLRHRRQIERFLLRLRTQPS